MKSLFFCCFVLSFVACATPDGAGVAVDSAAAPAVSADAVPSAAPVASAESVPSAAPSVSAPAASASAEAAPAVK